MPARGMERWLSQRLSHRLGARPGRGDGVCAGVEFRTPRSLVAEVTGTGDDDPWAPDALAWPLLEVIDALARRAVGRHPGPHLGHGRAGEEGELRRGRRFAVARRLAGAVRVVRRRSGRALLTDWSAGRDTDGCGGPLAGDLAWQPELWRRWSHRGWRRRRPAERHAATLAALRDDPAAVDLPARVCLFGHTRLPVTEVELLAALGRAPRRPPLAAPPVAGAVGGAGAGTGRRRGRAPSDRAATRWSGHPLLATPRPRHPRAAAGARPPSRPSTERSPAEPTPPTPCSGGCRPTCAANARRPGGAAARPAARTTGPSRCTPATARPARSRCCARCCSACSPTTRRSSRATCW